ncbi:MAG TPA: DinB family protein [Pyrinomonadaceae bacterium]|nr:DinB family protein [Pyrinomonadaceae bacterium]
MSAVGDTFIEEARSLLTKDYLPKIERCVALLNDEQVWWRANPASNSIGNLLLHLSGNVRQWIVVGLGGAVDTRNRDAEFAQRDVISRDEILRRLRETLREADRTLAGFDNQKLLDRFAIQGMEVSALAGIMHVVEHFSMHTGQVILLAKMFAEVDLEFYDFKSGAPVLTWKTQSKTSS